VEVEEGPLESGSGGIGRPGRRGLEGDGLDEGDAVVEAVPEGDRPGRRIEVPTDDPEGTERIRVESGGVAHRAVSVVVDRPVPGRRGGR